MPLIKLSVPFKNMFWRLGKMPYIQLGTSVQMRCMLVLSTFLIECRVEVGSWIQLRKYICKTHVDKACTVSGDSSHSCVTGVYGLWCVFLSLCRINHAVGVAFQSGLHLHNYCLTGRFYYLTHGSVCSMTRILNASSS